MTTTSWIHGPIVSSGDLEAHARLFTTFGMTEVLRRSLDADACSRQWGTTGAIATELVLATPGTRWGARVVQFTPRSDVVVRDRGRGYDADAPKVVDFYVPDFAAACAHVEAAGWTIKQPVAEYDLPEGHFVEAHVWGPDEVVCALIAGPAEFFRGFACIKDRMFSEPQSLSGPVSRLEPAIAFFDAAFGFGVVSRYGIDDESFRELVGSSKPQFNLRAVNVGANTREPYFGLIHYGMPDGSYASLAGRARPPHRGTLGATVMVSDVDATVANAAAAGALVLAEACDAEVGAFGRTRCALLLAPNGGCYQVVQAV